MSGAPDQAYVVARQVLLDALEALGAHRSSVVLVGAQAIYIRCGDADLVAAEYTTDADLALDPPLRPEPLIADVLQSAGFAPCGDSGAVGTWVTPRTIAGVPTSVGLDLLVPEAVGGDGRRAAKLGPQGNRTARKARGLEAALVDRRTHVVGPLDGSDSRRFGIDVAGPAALLVAKIHKIDDRADHPHRSSDKDALDVLRLLRGTAADDMAATLSRLLKDGLAGQPTAAALTLLEELFGGADAAGSQMAARAAAPEQPDTIAASCAALCEDMLVTLARYTGEGSWPSPRGDR